MKFPPLELSSRPRAADYRVALKSGPVAYIVPNRELPLVNIVVYAHVGTYLEPAGKEGVAELTGNLLTRGGTKSKTAEALEERLAFLAAQLNSSIGDTQGSVSLNLLSKDLDEGLGILREVLTAPRFQEDRLTLRKEQALQAMKQRNDDSEAIEAREAGFLAYGEKFWANDYATAASLESITRADMESFHRKWFHPDNFVVAVSGDFDRDEMKAKLEKLFADWPFAGEKPTPIPTNTEFASTGRVSRGQRREPGARLDHAAGHQAGQSGLPRRAGDERHPGRRRVHLAHHEQRAHGGRAGLFGVFEFPGRGLLSADVSRRVSIEIAHGDLCGVDRPEGNEKDDRRASRPTRS